MKYRLTISGLAVDCADEESVLRLIERLKGAEKPAQLPLAPRIPKVDAAPKAERQKLLAHMQRTREFLIVLRTGGDHGVSPDQLCSTLGIKHVKGLGGLMTAVNPTLNRLGFKPEYCYEKRAVSGGVRWYAMQKAQDAIVSVEEELRK